MDGGRAPRPVEEVSKDLPEKPKESARKKMTKVRNPHDENRERETPPEMASLDFLQICKTEKYLIKHYKVKSVNNFMPMNVKI